MSFLGTVAPSFTPPPCLYQETAVGCRKANKRKESAKLKKGKVTFLFSSSFALLLLIPFFTLVKLQAKIKTNLMKTKGNARRYKNNLAKSSKKL